MYLVCVDPNPVVDLPLKFPIQVDNHPQCTNAGPWLSPKLVTVNNLPIIVLPDIDFQNYLLILFVKK